MQYPNWLFVSAWLTYYSFSACFTLFFNMQAAYGYGAGSASSSAVQQTTTTKKKKAASTSDPKPMGKNNKSGITPASASLLHGGVDLIGCSIDALLTSFRAFFL